MDALSASQKDHPWQRLLLRPRGAGHVGRADDMKQQAASAPKPQATVRAGWLASPNHRPPPPQARPRFGTYLLNRCLDPWSALAAWFQRTVLDRLLPLQPSQLSSQRFTTWISPDAIQAIERDLVAAMVRDFRPAPPAVRRRQTHPRPGLRIVLDIRKSARDHLQPAHRALPRHHRLARIHHPGLRQRQQLQGQSRRRRDQSLPLHRLAGPHPLPRSARHPSRPTARPRLRRPARGPRPACHPHPYKRTLLLD